VLSARLDASGVSLIEKEAADTQLLWSAYSPGDRVVGREHRVSPSGQQWAFINTLAAPGNLHPSSKSRRAADRAVSVRGAVQGYLAPLAVGHRRLVSQLFVTASFPPVVAMCCCCS
jgi:hypothetical protein